MADVQSELARELFEKAYALQMQGHLDLAADLYRRSIQLHPTAEAHTFLGWTYRHQGKLDEAIRECKEAIALDPGYGNPYNDIGAYLIEKGLYDEAIPWLEKALDSPRYDALHFPWYNLGRVYASQELFRRAMDCFRQALEIDPGYAPAGEALQRLKLLIQ